MLRTASGAGNGVRAGSGASPEARVGSPTEDGSALGGDPANAGGDVLHEVDPTGRVVDRIDHPPGGLRDASEAMAERIIDRTGLRGPASRMVFAMNAHDADAVRACMAPSCVFEDRRVLRVVEFPDADAHVEALRAAFALSPDYAVAMRRVFATEPWGQVVLIGSTGTTDYGSAFEVCVTSLSVWDDDGLVTLVGVYEPDDAEAAIARLYELGPRDGGVTPA
jgi:hypothetical protein